MTVAQWTELTYDGPFDLAASARFLEGFAPAARPDAAARRGELRFAFPAAPSWRPVGLVVRQEAPNEPVRIRTIAQQAASYGEWNPTGRRPG